MADHEDRAAVFQEPVFEEFERFRIEVVGRLVQDQDIGGDAEELRQKQAIAFTAREGADRRQDLVRRKEEILEITHDMPGDAADEDRVVAVGDILLQGPVFVELGAELIEVGDPDSGPQTDRALLRLQFAEKELEERGLARSRWDR